MPEKYIFQPHTRPVHLSAMDPNDSFNFIVQDNDEFEDVADHSAHQVMEYFWYTLTTQ